MHKLDCQDRSNLDKNKQITLKNHHSLEMIGSKQIYKNGQITWQFENYNNKKEVKKKKKRGQRGKKKKKFNYEFS